jgi:hypothetical protein
VGPLRAAVARAVIAVDPEGAAERHRHARRDRRVVFTSEPEGMAGLWRCCPRRTRWPRISALEVLARALGRADPPGMDARRADLMVDLLTVRRCALTHPGGPAGCAMDSTDTHTRTGTDGGPVDGGRVRDAPTGVRPGDGSAGDGSAGGGRWWVSQRGSGSNATSARLRLPSVHVTVPITMLMGLDESPGELRGYGPIPRWPARSPPAAPGHGCSPTRITARPRSQHLYPAPALAGHVRARDVGCSSPVCRRSAAESDLDHAVPWGVRGATSEHDLRELSPRPSTQNPRPQLNWTVQQSSDGTITYTTPTGHRYASRPHDYRPDPHQTLDSDRTSDSPPGRDQDLPPF